MPKLKPTNYHFAHPFTSDEWIVILEFARIQMADAEAMDTASDEMDVELEWLRELRHKLQIWMEADIWMRESLGEWTGKNKRPQSVE